MPTVQLTDELDRLEVAYTADIPKVPSDIGAATASQGAKADSAVQPEALAAVATSGQYSSLNGKPAIPSSPSDIGAATAAQGALAQTAVQQVPGKGLSSNDYTTSDQQKLGTMPAFGTIYGRDIGGFGDSFTANCHTQVATAYATENYGYLGNVAALSGTAYSSYLNNFGVVGENTAQFLARIAAPLASACKVFLFPSVTNDFTTSGMTLDDTKRNVMDIIEQFTNAGKLIIVGTGTPRFADKLALVSAQRQLDYPLYRDWVLSYVSQFVPVVNTYDDFVQADTVDNLHPNPGSGALKIAQKFLPVIQSLKMKPIPVPMTPLDTYSANAPKGSLTPNVSLSTTLGTGTAQATALADAGSVVADGWTMLGSGLTGVSTHLATENTAITGMNAQTAKLSGAMTAAGGYLSFQPLANVALANLVSGDVISFMAAYSVSGTQRGLLSAELELIIVKPVGGASTTIYYRSMDKYQTGFPMPANGSGILESQRYTVDKTETSIRVRAACYLETSVAQDQRVSFSQPALRRI